MITNCLDLSEEMQIKMMDRVRKWKSTTDAVMMQTFTTPSSVMYGRGNTPKTYNAFLDMKRIISPNTTMYDYLITTSSNELVGVMGYSKLYINDETQVSIGSFYFIEFEPMKHDSDVQNALEFIYDEMLSVADEVCIKLPTFESRWNENRYYPKAHHRVIQTHEYKHTNAQFEELNGKYFILKGYNKNKGA